MKKHLAELFWEKVQITDTCWLWIGQKNKFGYGQFYNYKTKKLVSAHRFSFEINIAKIPDGLCVLHHCDIRNCIRPSHLWTGTHKQNTQDMFKKRRENKAKGIRHGNCTLSEEDVIKIKHLWFRTGMKQREIAEIFKISRGQICSIIKGKYWSHLKTY